MAIARTVREYLDRRGVEYELLPHPFSTSSSRTAAATHVPGDQLAKSVVLADEQGYLMAVVPATRRVELADLHRRLQRKLELATEQELDLLFRDCERGAIPPLGEAYGLATILDDSLSECSDIYFEAGDHTDVVHVRGRDFLTLMGGAERARFSQHT